MKSNKIHFLKGVYLVSTLATLLILAGISITACKNQREEQLYAVFSLPEQGIISSLDSLDSSTLLIGTEQGKLHFYRPTLDDGPYCTITVGEHNVYFAYPYKDYLFVGISDEGLKLYTKDGEYKNGYALDINVSHYATYQVQRWGDTLFCATSSGLAILDLSTLEVDTILRLIYPKPTGQPDCNVKKIWLSGDKLKVLYNDSIRSFDRRHYNKPVDATPLILDNPWEDTLTIADNTYKFKQGDNKFYVFSNNNVVPHNVMLVCDNNNGDGIVAITEDQSFKKNVYMGDNKRVSWERAWSNCLSRYIPGQIKDALFFPNGSCLLLTTSEKLFKGDKRSLQPLEITNNPKETSDRGKYIYYHNEGNWRKLYIALGTGYTTYDLDKNGNPIWDSEEYHDTTTSARSITVFKDTLYIGTLHNSIILKDKNDKTIDTLPHNNIRDIAVSDDCRRFLLTSNALFVGDSMIRIANVRKLHKYQNNVIGTSAEHFYFFSSDGHIDTLQLNPTFGHVNPFAFCTKKGFLYIGTDKGLLVSDRDCTETAFNCKEDKLTSVLFEDSCLKEYNIWSFILAGVIVIALLVVLLIFRSKRITKNKLIAANSAIQNLTDVKENLENASNTVKNLNSIINSLNETEDELKNVDTTTYDLDNVALANKTIDNLKIIFNNLKGLKNKLEKANETIHNLRESKDKWNTANTTIGELNRLKDKLEDANTAVNDLNLILNNLTETNDQVAKLDTPTLNLNNLDNVALANKTIDNLKIIFNNLKGLKNKLEKANETIHNLRESKDKWNTANTTIGELNRLKDKLEDANTAVIDLYSILNDLTETNDQVNKLDTPTLNLNNLDNVALANKTIDNLKIIFNNLNELKNKLEKANETIHNLKKSEDYKKDAIENLRQEASRHPYLIISSENLPSKVDNSKDWITQTAAQYSDKCKDSYNIINTVDFTERTTVKDLQEQIEEEMLEYAFAAELFNLRQSWKNESLHELKQVTPEIVKKCYEEITKLNNLYMTKIVSYNENNSIRESISSFMGNNISVLRIIYVYTE